MRSMEEQRRARTAALGVGTAFVGAALILLPVAVPIAVTLLLMGVVVTGWMLHHGVVVERAPAPTIDLQAANDAIGPALDDIAATLLDLRREAAATELVLRRVREHAGDDQRSNLTS